MLYENGWGVKRDYARARTWYEKAVAQGNAVAQTNLGMMYESGNGVNKILPEPALGTKKPLHKAMPEPKAISVCCTKRAGA